MKRRAQDIITNTIKYVDDIDNVKGLGFCVSIKHAEFMAEEFNNAGIPSIALTYFLFEKINYCKRVIF